MSCSEVALLLMMGVASYDHFTYSIVHLMTGPSVLECVWWPNAKGVGGGWEAEHSTLAC